MGPKAMIHRLIVGLRIRGVMICITNPNKGFMCTTHIMNTLITTEIFDFEAPKTRVDPLKMIILGGEPGDPYVQLAISQTMIRGGEDVMTSWSTVFQGYYPNIYGGGSMLINPPCDDDGSCNLFWIFLGLFPQHRFLVNLGVYYCPA